VTTVDKARGLTSQTKLVDDADALQQQQQQQQRRRREILLYVRNELNGRPTSLTTHVELARRVVMPCVTVVC